MVLTYSAASDLLVAAFARHLESNIVGSIALDLEGAGREVVEVLVKKLRRHESLAIGVRRRAERGATAGNAARQELQSLAVAGVALTSFAALAMSEKAGTDMMEVFGDGMGENSRSRALLVLGKKC